MKQISRAVSFILSLTLGLYFAGFSSPVFAASTNRCFSQKDISFMSQKMHVSEENLENYNSADLAIKKLNELEKMCQDDDTLIGRDLSTNFKRTYSAWLDENNLIPIVKSIQYTADSSPATVYSSPIVYYYADYRIGSEYCRQTIVYHRFILHYNYFIIISLLMLSTYMACT